MLGCFLFWIEPQYTLPGSPSVRTWLIAAHPADAYFDLARVGFITVSLNGEKMQQPGAVHKQVMGTFSHFFSCQRLILYPCTVVQYLSWFREAAEEDKKQMGSNFLPHSNFHGKISAYLCVLKVIC
jgi:hypothetical protein